VTVGELPFTLFGVNSRPSGTKQILTATRANGAGAGDAKTAKKT
jgi:hypothetical protein